MSTYILVITPSASYKLFYHLPIIFKPNSSSEHCSPKLDLFKLTIQKSARLLFIFFFLLSDAHSCLILPIQ